MNKIATLTELETTYSIEDMWMMNQVLDIQEDADRQALQRSARDR